MSRFQLIRFGGAVGLVRVLKYSAGRKH